jgi:putative ABC transport system ATP-binding protein
VSGLPLLVEDLVVHGEARGRSGPAAPILAVERLGCPAGARIALVGPSGSGKTTLLHALAGLLRPAAGRVAWGAEDVTGLREGARDAWRRRRVGLVFQDFHLVPELDVLGNVLLPARFAAWRVAPALRARAEALIAAVGLAAPRRRVGLLSRGEQQRTAVARALLSAPPILLADEPTASLDAANAEAVADLLVRLAGEAGATLVVATHDPGFARRFDTVWRLSAGRLAADAPARGAA